MALSPDGTRLYVGGLFTTANGQTRNRIAAYNTATGALVTAFNPSIELHGERDRRDQHDGLRRRRVQLGQRRSPVTGWPPSRASDGALLGLESQVPTATCIAMVISPDDSTGGRRRLVHHDRRRGRLRAWPPSTPPRALQDLECQHRGAQLRPELRDPQPDQHRRTVWSTAPATSSARGGNFEGAFAASSRTADADLARGLPRRQLRRLPGGRRACTWRATPTPATTSAASRRCRHGPSSERTAFTTAATAEGDRQLL